MADLIAEPTSFAKAEIVWRVGIPLAALVVTLLAMPLAHTNPRVGRSFNLIIAVLAFAIYLNVLNTVQAWVQQDRIDFVVAVWIVHAIVLACVALLFARRVYLQRWWPRRLTLRHWMETREK